MSFETELQKAIYTSLTTAAKPTISADFAAGSYSLYSAAVEAGRAYLSDTLVGVYDNVPQPLDGGAASNFPYITIGEDDFTDWSTDTESGADVTVTIHSWSRYRGRKEIKAIQSAVYGVLHRATLSVNNWYFVSCDFLTSNTLVDPDGLTRHGIQTFRILLDETP